MLVVVAIIGILCVLLLSVFPKVIGAADSAKCASNLRNIGQAIGFYVNDNSYMLKRPTLPADWFPVQGQLPGPLNHGQQPMCNWANYKGMLAYWLSPYIGLPEPTGTNTNAIPLFQCPAWKKQSANPINVSYLWPNLVYQGQTYTNLPFGYVDSQGHPSPTPMRMVALPAPLSEIIVLEDVDQMNANAGAAPYDTLPKKPVHNGKRNYLYLDDHIESK